MEVESFEDEEVAKLLNDRFVSIKVFTYINKKCCLLLVKNDVLTIKAVQVDREERPDVDKVLVNQFLVLHHSN